MSQNRDELVSRHSHNREGVIGVGIRIAVNYNTKLRCLHQKGVVVIPRLAEVAGFEIGPGININIALPEEMAQFMREQKGE